MLKRLMAVLITAILLTGCSERTENLTDLPVQPAIVEQDNTNEDMSKVEQDNTNEDVSKVTNTDVVPAETPEQKSNVQLTTKVETSVLLSTNFSNGAGAFMPRGSASISVDETEAYEGVHSLKVTGRTETWNGAMVDMSGQMQDGLHYNLVAWVKYNEGFDSIPILAMLERNGGEYLSLGTVVAKKGEWAKIEGDIIIPNGTNSAIVYFETQWKTDFVNEDLCDFYIGSVVITEGVVVSPTASEDIPALKSIYQDYFSVGCGIEPSDLNVPEIRDIVIKHFDTITCGNQMKPDYLLDHKTSVSDPKFDTSPAVRFDQSDILMEFASANGLNMRGHTLLWHSQTPRWLFTVGYSTEPDAEFVERETMLLRMENYIRQVLEYYQTKYPGVIIAWDVVNEAIETADRHVKGYRIKESLWYQVVGSDYIEKAFEYARKYADDDVKLFYNDYNTFISNRTYHMSELLTTLKEKGLVDGMGMQGHISVDSPSLFVFEDTIRKYCSLGLEVQITELDMSMKTNDDESLLEQGKRYARLGEMLRNLSDEGLPVTNMTLWGVTDSRSWLNKDGPNYPLLFDKHFNAKPAFWGLVDASILEQ